LNSSKLTINSSPEKGRTDSKGIDMALEEEFTKLNDFTNAVRHLKDSILKNGEKTIQELPDKIKSQ